MNVQFTEHRRCECKLVHVIAPELFKFCSKRVGLNLLHLWSDSDINARNLRAKMSSIHFFLDLILVLYPLKFMERLRDINLSKLALALARELFELLS